MAEVKRRPKLKTPKIEDREKLVAAQVILYKTAMNYHLTRLGYIRTFEQSPEEKTIVINQMINYLENNDCSGNYETKHDIDFIKQTLIDFNEWRLGGEKKYLSVKIVSEVTRDFLRILKSKSKLPTIL